MRRATMALVLGGLLAGFAGCNAIFGLEAGEPKPDGSVDGGAEVASDAGGDADGTTPETAADATDSSIATETSTEAGDAAETGIDVDAGSLDFTFPNTGEDSASLSSFGTMCDKDNYLEGTRVSTLPSVTSLKGTMELEFNSLDTTCPALPDAGGKETLDVNINDIPIGNLTILPSSGTKIAVDFTFPSIALKAGGYKLRIHSKATVPSGCGCFGPLWDVSKYTLR